jgi:integrase
VADSGITVLENKATLVKFGKNDRGRYQRYILMITAFLEGKPENTKRTYSCAIRQFFDLFKWISPEDITPAHVVAYKKWLLEHRGVMDSTAYSRMSAVSSLFTYLCMYDTQGEKPLLSFNPFKVVPKNDIQPTPYSNVIPIEWKVLKTIINALPTNAQGLRDKAILLFLAFTGRRRAEVAHLKIKDLDLKARPRTYRAKEKGGRITMFELPNIVYDAIRAYWIASDRLRDLKADSGVFTANTSTNLTKKLDPHRTLNVRTINNILNRARIRAKVDKRGVHVHAIRHMAARDLDKAGLRLQDIQAFLDHLSPATTQIYLGKLQGPVPAHEDVLLGIRAAAEELGKNLIDDD